MAFRRMNPADYEGALALWQATEGMGLNASDDSPAGFRRYLERNPGTCHVAEEGGEIVGAVLCGHDGRRGLIYHLAVAPAARGRGIGGALVDRALASLREESIRKAYIMVYEDNDGALEFWRKKGFSAPGAVACMTMGLGELEYLDARGAGG